MHGLPVEIMRVGETVHVNKNYVAGLLPLYPTGTNSAFFTECCQVAICDDQPNCPLCKRHVIGWNAESADRRGRIRWEHAYRR